MAVGIFALCVVGFIFVAPILALVLRILGPILALIINLATNPLATLFNLLAIVSFCAGAFFWIMHAIPGSTGWFPLAVIASIVWFLALLALGWANSVHVSVHHDHSGTVAYDDPEDGDEYPPGVNDYLDYDEAAEEEEIEGRATAM